MLGVAQRACDSQDEVVSGLVLEEKRNDRLEEGAGIVELLDDHRFIL